MEHHKIKIGITQGDGNGTSYEVMLKSFLEQHIQEICTPVVYGSPKIAAYYRKALNINNFSFNPADNADNVQTGKASLINVLDDTAKVELGSATQASGEAAAVSLERAVADLSAGKLEALVLNPLPAISCKTLQVSSQFDYIKQKLGASNTMTMLVNGAMRVALLTDARPMRNIAKSITVDNIVGKLHLLADSLKSDFAIDNPRIAVLGYNPNCTDAENQEFEEKRLFRPLRKPTAKAFWPLVLSMPTPCSEPICSTVSMLFWLSTTPKEWLRSALSATMTAQVTFWVFLRCALLHSNHLDMRRLATTKPNQVHSKMRYIWLAMSPKIVSNIKS